MSINFNDITKFDRTDKELYEFLFSSVAVAGKTAKVIEQKVNNLFKSEINLENIKKIKLGKYNLFEKFLNFNLPNLKTCTLEDLLKIPGVGNKTARFFLIHSRPNQSFAVLDVHILRFMREYLKIDTPKQTPESNLYLKLEKEFLSFTEKISKPMSKIDLDIWNHYANKTSLPKYLTN